ncbi:MAG: hypothetical protein CL606_05985 [Anaerolineaceae bacterium]|nr:hypothetical protein [Chloroflexota bacterium]MBS60837.1 hypothetical protein [Anaerolineaceae bacterium]
MADEQEINPDELLEAIQRKMGSTWHHDIDFTDKLQDSVWAGMTREEIIADVFGGTVEENFAMDEANAKANRDGRQTSRYPFELYASYLRWLEGDSQTEIFQFLQDAIWEDGTGDRKYEDVGLRTITRWISNFKELPHEQDRGGIWFHNCEKYGIPGGVYSDIVQTGVKVTPRYAKWMGRLKEVRHRGRPWHNRIVMSYTRQFVEEEQKEMLGLNHNLGGVSMHLEVRLMDNPRKGDTV